MIRLGGVTLEPTAINNIDAFKINHTDDETRFYPQDELRTMKRLQKEKSRLGFVDA